MSDKQIINKISEEVIGKVAMRAALSVPGVNHLEDSLTGNISKRIAGNEAPAGVKVSRDKEGYIIDIYAIADFGCLIPRLAWDIQNSVKDRISVITNKKIKAVNIHVQGVTMASKKLLNREKNKLPKGQETL